MTAREIALLGIRYFIRLLGYKEVERIVRQEKPPQSAHELTKK